MTFDLCNVLKVIRRPFELSLDSYFFNCAGSCVFKRRRFTRLDSATEPSQSGVTRSSIQTVTSGVLPPCSCRPGFESIFQRRQTEAANLAAEKSAEEKEMDADPDKCQQTPQPQAAPKTKHLPLLPPPPPQFNPKMASSFFDTPPDSPSFSLKDQVEGQREVWIRRSGASPIKQTSPSSAAVRGSIQDQNGSDSRAGVSKLVRFLS